MARLRYRPELDGLRAVAVLLVVVHHALQPTRFVGFIGVDVFFVLSGYLITTNLLGEYQGTRRLRLGTFYVRRLLRLYPALLVMLVVTVAAAPLLDLTRDYLAKRAALAAVYVGNVYMTYAHHWLGPFTHTWSLALEEQYYLVWPLLLWGVLALRWPRRAVAAGLGVLAVVSAVLTVRDFGFGQISFPLQTTGLGLLVGSALALVPPGPAAPDDVAVPGAWWRTVAPVLGVAVTVAALVGFSATDAVPDGAYVVAAVVASALLIGHTTAMRGTGFAVRLLSYRPEVYFGKISYGIYLWHYPLLFVVLRQAPGMDAALRFVVVAVGGTLLAAVSHRWVEKPFLRLKSRLSVPALRNDRPSPRQYAPGVSRSRPDPVARPRVESSEDR